MYEPYICDWCGAEGHRLWRQIGEPKPRLLCRACSWSKNVPKKAPRNDTPAIPHPDGSFYGATVVLAYWENMLLDAEDAAAGKLSRPEAVKICQIRRFRLHQGPAEEHLISTAVMFDHPSHPAPRNVTRYEDVKPDPVPYQDPKEGKCPQ